MRKHSNISEGYEYSDSHIKILKENLIKEAYQLRTQEDLLAKEMAVLEKVCQKARGSRSGKEEGKEKEKIDGLGTLSLDDLNKVLLVKMR